jgi:FkbM family methyltransferase
MKKKNERSAYLDQHLRQSKGILHLGAHVGQEAEYYSGLSKPVIWIEAMPNIYGRLTENIKKYSNQLALNALLTDKDNVIHAFNISNYLDGVSSSIFKFGKYSEGEKTLWPKHNLHMVDSVNLSSTRLDTLMETNNIEISQYNFWIVDLQGAELLALKGAEKSLKSCDKLYVEVSLDEVYKGGVLYPELLNYLNSQGFIPTFEPRKIHDDVLFVRKNSI